MVPLALGRASSSSPPERDLTFFNVNWSARHVMTAEPTLEEDELESLVRAFGYVSEGHPFGPYADLRREANAFSTSYEPIQELPYY